MHDIKYEIVANRLIMNGVRWTEPQFDLQLNAAWRAVYPGVQAPSVARFREGLWQSSRRMLENADLWNLSRSDQGYFLRERLLYYHAMRLRPHLNPEARISDLCRAMLHDLKQMGMCREEDQADERVLRAVRCYYPLTQEKKTLQMQGDFNEAECRLITEMYQWILKSWSAGPQKRQYREESAHEAGSGRNRDLERKTRRRVNGQLAVDMLMMTRNPVEPEDVPLDEEDALELFIKECAGSRTYAGCSAAECEELWKGANAEDRTLFTRGAITALVDSRFYIIGTRCLLMAIAELPEGASGSEAEVLPQAQELLGAFRLDGGSEQLGARLKKILKRNYLVGQSVPPEILETIRERQNDIANAYEMYSVQVAEAVEEQAREFEKRLAQLRRNDQQQYRREQRERMMDQIRWFVDVDRGGFLGLLCMVVNGTPCSEENMRYFLEGFMHQLEDSGLEPFAHEYAGKTFEAGPDTEDFLDVQGCALTAGQMYQLIQPGWRYQGAIIVVPRAKPV